MKATSCVPLRPLLAAIAVVLALGAAALGSPVPEADGHGISEDIAAGRGHVDALSLASAIRQRAPLVLLDVRDSAAFAAHHIPTARSTPLVTLMDAALARDTTVVLYSDDGSHAGQAWVLLRARGYDNVRFLRAGMQEWVERVLDPKLAVDATPAESAAYAAAVPVSRYFGGMPRRGVPRVAVPSGYWTSPDSASTTPVPLTAVENVGRRGC